MGILQKLRKIVLGQAILIILQCKNSYCQCITVTVSGDVQLNNKELYFVFEGSSLRHITSVQRIDGNRLRIPIPDHDVPEVVQVSLIVRAEDGIHPLATSQFEYRQDQGQYVAEFLLFSTINDEAAEFLAALSPESIGLRDVDIAELDNRLATGLKLTNILPRNWSLLRHNSDGKVFIVNQDTILHFATRFGLLQTLKFLLQASDAQRGLMVKNKRNELVIDVAKKYGHRSIENYMQRNIVDDDNDCIGIYLLESYAKVLINGLAMITRQKAKTDFSPNEDIKKIQQLQDFAADEPLEKIYADNALLRQFKNSLRERGFGIDHITIQSITPQSSAIGKIL
ncbi:uncharacterized protein TRIADDRAFT_54349 [Trichoplax adhaerens]|uniref:IPT/TIG domain-containing protein n=1 Tax=Trichoplax adhaerens TaxID=10228 RepID=B3RRS7_TRIAD|nr:hypothetical protein TRIADDRAFT_54349 [Trichoplax adhaerens]EDV26921.1 hypothetical protein TRIADDRAFT_54349 [Trichoplax adhaerens]|eukprot:XP_002110917.1 hypothetical protein TRIADDRAFT_54349 [Trichoplax adhaerens]